ncbi:Delta(3),Delta(2)-enoyl-CoA isomerase [Caenorhabditis elegans]|uniref:Delta(3),Delta(2)-enoyl-CoA isomerase n=1 Tax=Caenorhabditis elegans TaxID=6239 RepID=Q09603_CAEEL|nr:ACB domain-containing protein [Caenorhabditis elegans]CAA86779.1 ACB domain-containing protein [Caenorhabditis elegans]|eukprot:NP_496330.1 Enoyl-CoA Hydratase [Caenorhabditis elegans]
MLRNLTLAARSVLYNPQVSVRSFSAQADFEKAQKNLKTLKEEPDNDVKLQLYGLFKQATAGDVQGKRPGMMDFVGRAKYDAWNTLKGQTQDEARANYAKLVGGLISEEASAAPEPTGPSIEGLENVDGLSVTREGKVFKIALNRPKKFNALTLEMYQGIQKALEVSNNDKSTSITVITANGSYYCAGNDLTNFKAAAGGTKEQIADMANTAKVIMKDYVNAYINHEKPLIALINGPAVGIAVTVLGMFDYVIATDKASFHTPFAPLGQSPEGVSSYTFPLIMGSLRASEMLLVCKKISAQTAKDYGLVNEVVPDAEFQSHAQKTVEAFSQLPPETLRINKKLLRSLHKEKLLEVNNIEADQICERWQSKECHQAIAAFMTKGAKK